MPEKSISAYCLILNNLIIKDFWHVLMVRDTYRDKKLSLPGGGMEQGELITETAFRETMEETGYEVEIEDLIGIFSHRKQIGAVHLFQASIIRDLQMSLPEEISWRGFIDISKHDPNDIYPAQLGMIKQFFESNENQWPIFGHMIPPLPNK